MKKYTAKLNNKLRLDLATIRVLTTSELATVGGGNRVSGGGGVGTTTCVMSGDGGGADFVTPDTGGGD